MRDRPCPIVFLSHQTYASPRVSVNEVRPPSGDLAVARALL